MSVMALSSQVGAPSSSFLSADKSIEPPRGAKSQHGQTYQGANGQAVTTVAAQTLGLNAPKLEASGVLEPSSSSFSAVISQPVSVSAKPSNITLGNRFLSSPSIDLGTSHKAILESELKAQLDSNQSNSSNASFSLLTGPLSIAGMREGQIASLPTFSVPQSTLSASNVNLTVLGGINGTYTSTNSPTIGSGLATRFVGPTMASSIGVSSSTMGDVLPSLVTPFLDTHSINPSANSGSNAVINPFTTDTTPNGVIDNAMSDTVADPTGFAIASALVTTGEGNFTESTERSNLAEQFNALFGGSATVNGQTDNQSAPAAQRQKEQANDEQATQAREKAAQEQKQKQQALAAIFAKETQQDPTEQTQDATQTREQELVKERIQQAQEKAIEQQNAQVEALKSRDSEVKAHEHAHATVGGQYAQSPSFKYEKGADGQRYATDGEVQIDVSIIPGDPIATINKMKQVYAAAMAPVDPSSADIRVAAEALKKMNEARAKLAEERQQQIVDQQTTETLIGAEAQIDELPQLKERQIQVTGDVDTQGNIAVPQDEPSAPVTDVIDKVKQAITTQIASSRISDAVNAPEVDTTDAIEPPTATLAIDLPQAAQDNSTQSLTNTVASLAAMTSSSQDLLQTGRSAMRFYGSVALANLTNSDDVNVSQSGVNTAVDGAIMYSEDEKNQRNSELSNRLSLESPQSQETRGLFNAQTLSLYRSRFLDVSV